MNYAGWGVQLLMLPERQHNINPISVVARINPQTSGRKKIAIPQKNRTPDLSYNLFIRK